MMSKKKLVTLYGVLKGNGHEAACRVKAVKVSLDAATFEYTDLEVTEVSRPLPDGVYELEVENKKIRVRQSPLGWLDFSGI
jgi:hypothetical protein